MSIHADDHSRFVIPCQHLQPQHFYTSWHHWPLAPQCDCNQRSPSPSGLRNNTDTVRRSRWRTNFVDHITISGKVSAPSQRPGQLVERAPATQRMASAVSSSMRHLRSLYCSAVNCADNLTALNQVTAVASRYSNRSNWHDVDFGSFPENHSLQ